MLSAWVIKKKKDKPPQNEAPNITEPAEDVTVNDNVVPACEESELDEVPGQDDSQPSDSGRPISTTDPSGSEPPAKKAKSAARPYKEYFLKYGFVNANAPDPKKDARPKCVICLQILANESLRPNKLKRHLETMHSELADKPLDFFECKAQEIKTSGQVLRKSVTLNDKAQLASYLVSYRVATEKQPHTIAENLILPAAIDMVSTVIDEKSAEKLKCIPLSNNTVSRRINDISDNLEEQLILRLQAAGDFSIQLDESTDISDCATLLVYVRYAWESEFAEDLLCCLTIPTGTTGEQIFSVLNDYVVTKCGLDWAKCKGITSDGAANMTGRNSGVVTRIKEAAGQDIVWNHCFIHRQALACKGIPQDLDQTLKEVVRVVNFIKGSSLNNRLFDQLCTDMGAEHAHLLFHTEVRWLSKGRVLTRVYELRNEIHAFLVEKKSPLADVFTNDWLLRLSYLADIFSSLNELNLKLQGQNDDVFRNWKHVAGFQKSLKLWLARLRWPNPSHYMFPTVSQHIEENDVPPPAVARLTALVQTHLLALIDNFVRYYPTERNDILTEKWWVQNPFDFESPESVVELELTPAEETELLQLTSDTSLKRRFERLPLSSFWLSVRAEYPVLSKESILLLLPFTTTYKCEVGFSVLTKMKTKHRNRLNAAPQMRVALSSCTPDWSAILKRKQAHLSH